MLCIHLKHSHLSILNVDRILSFSIIIWKQSCSRLPFMTQFYLKSSHFFDRGHLNLHLKCFRRTFFELMLSASNYSFLPIPPAITIAPPPVGGWYSTTPLALGSRCDLPGSVASQWAGRKSKFSSASRIFLVLWALLHGCWSQKNDQTSWADMSSTWRLKQRHVNQATGMRTLKINARWHQPLTNVFLCSIITTLADEYTWWIMLTENFI